MDTVEDQIVVADAVKRAGPKVAEALGVKGGGRPGLYQGKAASLEKVAEAKAALDREAAHS